MRKESYRPDCDSIRLIGKPIPSTRDNWAERGRYVLRNASRSMEELCDQQAKDGTSLGIFKPKNVMDLRISSDTPQWPPKFLAALQQRRLFESRHKTLVPPRRVPFKFHYLFECDDARCKGNHRMSIEDWEVGVYFWRMVDKYKMSHRDAAEKVRQRFLGYICGNDRNTFFQVGTILAHPKTWVIVGVFYPKVAARKPKAIKERTLFDVSE